MWEVGKHSTRRRDVVRKQYLGLSLGLNVCWLHTRKDERALDAVWRVFLDLFPSSILSTAMSDTTRDTR